MKEYKVTFLDKISMTKCSSCSKRAEFKDEEKSPKKFYCENHARKELFKGKAFLPRIKK